MIFPSMVPTNTSQTISIDIDLINLLIVPVKAQWGIDIECMDIGSTGPTRR